MSTIDLALAENLKRHNGWHNGDSDNSLGDNPQVTRIVEYTNAWGILAYGFTTKGQDPEKYLRPTEYVQNPRIWWEAR